MYIDCESCIDQLISHQIFNFSHQAPLAVGLVSSGSDASSLASGLAYPLLVYRVSVRRQSVVREKILAVNLQRLHLLLLRIRRAPADNIICGNSQHVQKLFVASGLIRSSVSRLLGLYHEALRPAGKITRGPDVIVQDLGDER